MSNDEIIKEIVNLASNLQIISETPTGRAIKSAIRHIQAWGKVKEEINQSKEEFSGKFTAESLKQIEYLHGRNEVRQQCLDIIDKHLQEVNGVN